MVNRSNTILASQFNTLQNRIAQLLGTGFGDFGYGQAVSSSLVQPPSDPNESDADNITVEFINNLRNDLAKIYRHQNGTNLPIDKFTSNDLIGADTSATEVTVTDNPASPGDFLYNYTNEDTAKGINDIIAFVSTAEVDRFIIASNQEEINIAVSDIRNTNWNNLIVSEFTVSFNNENERRYFFNAGGEIRFEGSMDINTSEGSSLQRDIGWKNMLENVGEVRFAYNSTFQEPLEDPSNPESGPTGTGVGYPDGIIGNYDLTSNYKIIFRKDANSGDYSENYWQIEAKERSNNQIDFKVSLYDFTYENVVEAVTADLQFEYSYRRANGEVVAPIPTFSIINSFE
jgi:hypothetical protein